MNVTNFGVKIFEDVIKLGQHHTRLGWAQTPMNVLFIRERRGRLEHTNRGESHVTTEAEIGLL